MTRAGGRRAHRVIVAVRADPMVSASVLLGAVALVWLIIRMASLDWHPMGDYRTLQLRVSDVGTGDTPLVGLYSRFGFNHPGPWIFWSLAGSTRLLGNSGLLVGAVVVNVASVAAAVGVSIRAGRQWAAVVALSAAALCCGIGLGGLADPWNPYLVVLPLFTMLVGAWRTFDGSRSGALLAIGAGSYALAGHVGSAPVVVAVLLVVISVLLWRSVSGRTPSTDRITLAWAVGLGAVMWLPALLEQVTSSPGNLRSLASFVMRGGEGGSNGVESGVRIVGRSLSFTFDWATGRSPTLAGGVLDTGAMVVPVAVVALVVASLASIRLRGSRERAVCAVAWIALVAQTLAMSRISGPLYPYLTRTTWAVAAFIWLAITGVLVSWVDRRITSVAREPERRWRVSVDVILGSVVVLMVITMSRGIDTRPLGPYPHWKRAQEAIVPAVIDAIRSAPGPILLLNGDLTDGAVGSEVLAAARASGLPLAKPSSLAYIVGSGRTMNPDDAASTLVIMSNERIDRYSRDPGCRLIVTFDSLGPEERSELAALELAPSEGLDSTGLTPAQIREAQRAAFDEWRVRQATSTSPTPEFLRFRDLANSNDVLAAFLCAGTR